MFLLWHRYMDCCNWLLYALLDNYAFSIGSYSPINKFYSFIIFSLLINAAILLLNYLVLMLYFFSFSQTFFSLLKHYLELYITDAALKVSRSFNPFSNYYLYFVLHRQRSLVLQQRERLQQPKQLQQEPQLAIQQKQAQQEQPQVFQHPTLPQQQPQVFQQLTLPQQQPQQPELYTPVVQDTPQVTGNPQVMESIETSWMADENLVSQEPLFSKA